MMGLGQFGSAIARRVGGGRLRSFFTSAGRRGGDHHDDGGVIGSNLPFDTKSRHKLAVYFGFWFGSGFAVPFLLLRHQLKKKNL